MKKNVSLNGRPRSIEVNSAILDATLSLLAETGYDRLTISAVAERARVGKATIYRRWNSKHSLVADAFQQLPPLVSTDMGSLELDLEQLLESLVQVMEKSPLALVLAALGKEQICDKSLAAKLDPIFNERRLPLIEVLRRATLRRELPDDIDIGFAADIVIGPIINRLFFTGISVSQEDRKKFIRGALYGIHALNKPSQPDTKIFV